MGCVRVHHSPPSRYRTVYRIVLAYLSSRARYDSVQASSSIEKSDLRRFFRNSFDTFSLSLSLYIYIYVCV